MSNQTPEQETCPAELPNWCAQRHWSIFWILIVCSVALISARVLTISNDRAGSDTPFFSANDRSRWVTVRALVDLGTYEIDELITDDQPISWDSIDKVQHLNAEGQLRFYSSKPPLFPTLLAGQYFLIKQLTGWEITNNTFPIARTILTITNAIPWLIYLWFFAKMINSIPVRDWSRYYVLACAAFGTYLSTFVVTINNHLPAAICVMIALYLVSQIFRKLRDSYWYFAAAGFFASLVVTFELPGLSFFACVGAICLWISPRKTLLAFGPAALLVLTAFVGTNYLAHGEVRPAYSHRSDGESMGSVEGDFSAALNRGNLPPELLSFASQELTIKRPAVSKGSWPSTPTDVQRWVVRDQITDAQFVILTMDGKSFDVRQWGNWYDYPDSYWLSENDEKKSEVDRGQDSGELYAFHVLFGHHGIFSLTPIWLLSLAGMVALISGVKLGGHVSMRWLGAMSLLLSIVVIAFYLNRPTIDRNYGGVCCTLRWLLWLTPLWLVCMLPIVDWLAWTKWGKFICCALLLISVVSANYAVDNPWVHPWLYEIWDWTGLPK